MDYESKKNYGVECDVHECAHNCGCNCKLDKIKVTCGSESCTCCGSFFRK